jgi:amino acid adenylation domain-containing protein
MPPTVRVKMDKETASNRRSFIPKLIEQQAHKTPSALAICAGKETLTYAELEARSGSLANHLRSIGVDREVVVALCLERSIAFVVGALGIMKAGGAYLPLDPAYPKNRLSAELRDARAEVAIVPERGGDALTEVGTPMVRLGRTGTLLDSATGDPNFAENAPEDLAYVIYTSGSTGQPKGVEIAHSSLVNLVEWHREAFRLKETDRASFLSGVGFDAAVWELWPCLAAGASVHIADDLVVKEPTALRDWLIAEGITISFVPTPIAERLLDLDWPEQTALKVLLTGADQLHKYPSPRVPFKVFNNYGPTECTVVATSGRVPADGESVRLPPIGKPIANTRIYLLDESRVPVSEGEEGEIWIAGSGLARGYRSNPDLTAKRFRADVFDRTPGARMYRTGDRGRLLPDGQFEFLGRCDEQIKIRGFRIEPAEVERHLTRHASVGSSAVVAHEMTTGEVTLVGFLTLNARVAPTSSELQDHLREQLPEYMIPAKFVVTTELPVTENGKIDRAALRKMTPDALLRDHVYVAPGTVTEDRLATIVGTLLKVPRVSVADNFFMLGGHSLMGTQLIARVRDAFGVELSLRFLFEFPSITAIAAEVERLVLARVNAMTDEEVLRSLEQERSITVKVP